MLKQVILLTALACLASASFIGHSVLRVVPDTEQQLLAVHKYLESNPSLDVWAEPRRLGLPVDVRVSALQRQGLERFFESQGLQHEVFVEDLDSLIKTQALQVQNGDEPFGWKSYYRLEQIYNWLDELVAGDPTVFSIINVGNSYEGRPMKGLKIKFGENKPIIMLESGIHAREWIGPASATFFINEILNSAADDVVRNYEWHIFPSVNPDGYEYTWTKDRNWRKTRTPHWFFFKGVDANRNWPFHWMESGATRIPWAEIYGGPKAESEVETRNLRAYLDSIAERVHVYLSLHSYSQLLMFPWGYASEHTSTHDKMNAIAGKAAAAIADVHGTEFVYGNIADTIYPASGSSLDYAYSKCVPFPFVFELRDRGRYGFMLPADQIIPAAEETWAGIRVIVQEVFASGAPAKNSC